MTPREAIALLTKPKSKYRAVKCEWRGEKFDSQRELKRHLVLLDMQKRGEIADLKRQPRYPLCVTGKKIIVGTYIPDWEYFLLDRWGHVVRQVCEDAKGFKTPDFKLKFKLAKALYPQIDWRLS